MVSEAKSEPVRRYAAPAAACAAQMLGMLASEPGPLTLAEITRGIGSTKSLAFRVARELQDAELIVKDGRGYQLGLGALELAAAVATRSDYSESLARLLEELAIETGETVNVGVLRDSDALIVMKHRAPTRVITITHIGQRLPANCTALGKVLLSTLSDRDIKRRLPKPLPALTPKSITDLDELLDDVRLARDEGYAVNREGSILGRWALAILLDLPELGPDPAALSVTASLDLFEERKAGLLDALHHVKDRAERESVARLALFGIEV